MKDEQPIIISPDHKDPNMSWEEFDRHNTDAKLAIAAAKEEERFNTPSIWDPLLILGCSIYDKIRGRGGR